MVGPASKAYSDRGWPVNMQPGSSVYTSPFLGPAPSQMLDLAHCGEFQPYPYCRHLMPILFADALRQEGRTERVFVWLRQAFRVQRMHQVQNVERVDRDG